MPATHLTPATHFHAQLLDIICDVTGKDRSVAGQLDAYLVEDLGCDPFEDGYHLSLAIEQGYPLIEPGHLTWIENDLHAIRVRDLCMVWGVSAN